jgi:RNA polymerase sigma-70 factor, ECF subfamily
MFTKSIAISSRAAHNEHRDRVWFETFFRDHYAALCAFAIRYVDLPHDAEEIVQDAMTQFWIHRAEPAEGALRTYAYTIVRNRCYDHLKKRRVRRRVTDEDAPLEVPTAGTPETDYREEETRAAIDSAINELPDRRREIFLMSRRDGLTYQEIADMLSISVKTVETQMGRSLKHLRHRLSDLLSISF